MKRKTYSLEFKEQALRKALERGQRTLQDVADELNLSLGTLKSWLKEPDKIRWHLSLTYKAMLGVKSIPKLSKRWLQAPQIWRVCDFSISHHHF